MATPGDPSQQAGEQLRQGGEQQHLTQKPFDPAIVSRNETGVTIERVSLDEDGIRVEESEPKVIRPVVALTTLIIYGSVALIGIGLVTYLSYIFSKPELFTQVFAAVFTSLATLAGTIIAHYFKGK